MSVFVGLDGSENGSQATRAPTNTPVRPEKTTSTTFNPSGMLPTALARPAATATAVAGVNRRKITATPTRTPANPSVVDAVSVSGAPITQPPPKPIPTMLPVEPDLSIPGANVSDLQGMRGFMLALINEERVKIGLDEVELGTNSAAQLHAEEMAAHGYLGHWGLDGRKSYMRYSDAGGTQYSAENVFGPEEYVSLELGFRSSNPEELLDEAMESLMASPGHKDNILRPKHRKVNLGIAYNGASVSVVQQFEGDYISFTQEPAIENGVLTFSGSMTGDLEFDGVHIYLDSLPLPASTEQINATYCVAGGTPIALFRPPVGPREYYTERYTDLRYALCSSPHEIDLSLEWAFRSVFYANAERIPWITADRWSVEEGEFTFEGELSDLVQQHGDGVYIVNIWADDDGDLTLVSVYPIYIE